MRKTSKVAGRSPPKEMTMSQTSPPPRVDTSHQEDEPEQEKVELRKRLLDMIKRQEMSRREKPR